MDAAAKTLLGAAATLLLCAAPAAAERGVYEQCGPIGAATAVSVSGTGCESVRPVVTALLAAPAADSAAVLRATGWKPLRADAGADGGEFDLVATRGRAALRVRRPGAAPDLDGWSAGRELLFARGRLVGGARPPSGTVLCTSAFLVMLPRNHPGGLSAAHCGGVRTDGTTHRRNAAMRRPPQSGIVLGRVQRNLARTRPLDALVVPVPSGASRPSSAVVDRGVARPPWFLAGVGRPTPGRRVCFTGRTSGIDQCGVILSGDARRINATASRIAGTKVTCTSITAREGDSGGPVYTTPRANGTVYAVGITTLVFGLFQSMCFTEIKPVLKALRATLVTAPAR